MKSFLLTLCAVALCLCASAQTIVDLNQKRVGSATVRPSINPDPFSKSRIQARDLAEERRDSAEFNDLLTAAFNYLHQDSLSQGQRLLEKALALRPKGKAAPVIRFNLGQICFARKQSPMPSACTQTPSTTDQTTTRRDKAALRPTSTPSSMQQP